MKLEQMFTAQANARRKATKDRALGLTEPRFTCAMCKVGFYVRDNFPEGKVEVLRCPEAGCGRRFGSAYASRTTLIRLYVESRDLAKHFDPHTGKWP